jgi:hypothetical protein
MQKRAVVLEPGERQDYAVMQQLRTIRNEKLAKRKAKVRPPRRARHRAREREAWGIQDSADGLQSHSLPTSSKIRL